MSEMERLSDEARADIEELLARGRTIDAIKRYRDDTGAGLAEAKAAVEGMAAAVPGEIDGGATPIGPKQGCAVLLLMLASVGLAVATSL